MKLVIIETPYRGETPEETQANIEYAKACMKDSIDKGETPFLSHLLYTQVLDDNDSTERQMGISLGLDWLIVADAHVFYTDKGISKGMRNALEYSSGRTNAYLITSQIPKNLLCHADTAVLNKNEKYPQIIFRSILGLFE